MKYSKLPVLLALGVMLSACAKSIYAPDADVQKWAYASPEPPSITLITMISNETKRAGHSAVVINGDQRVLYDPAGHWTHKRAPERNDLVYGISPSVMDSYNSFHSRSTHHVVLQTVNVTPDVARIAYQAATKQGASPQAFCANNVSKLLSQIPGFSSIGHTFWPIKAMKKFAELPNVSTRKIYEDDIGQN